MHEKYNDEKVQCRKREFEVFMNVILLKNMIHNSIVKEFSEEMFLYLIIAGMNSVQKNIKGRS